MAGFFTRAKDKFIGRYKLDVGRVVKEYDAFLQSGLLTTSSFQDILDDKPNRKRRALQLTYLLYLWLYFIPRYCFLCLLYFENESTRIYFEYILADYAEELGMFGRTFNVIYSIFAIGVFLNTFVMRKSERQRSQQFLTDWLKRIPKKNKDRRRGWK